MTRIAHVSTVVILITVLSASSTRHWTETAKETIWRGIYKNCDKGYSVILPENVVGHGSHSPNPNHGILISPDKPSSTSEVTLDDSRVIAVWDSYDSEEFGSAISYLDWHLDNDKHKLKIIERGKTTFRGMPAAYVRYRMKAHPSIERDELIVYRTGEKNSGPIFYGFDLKTSAQYAAQDRDLYLKVRKGFRIQAVPRGECSND